MSSFYCFLFALIAIIQLAQASFPYNAYYADYPVISGYYSLADPYFFSPVAYDSYPYAYPYTLYSRYHYPSNAARNVVKSFQREEGHLSDTRMISPFAKTYKKIRK